MNSNSEKLAQKLREIDQKQKSVIFTEYLLKIMNKLDFEILDFNFSDSFIENSEQYPENKYEQNLSLIYILTNNIEFTKFNQYSGSFNFVSTKAAHDMLLLINSTSSEFNLRLRPMIKNYFTKAYELVKRVDEAQFRLNRFRYGK